MIRRLSRLIWTGNVLLIAAIAAFAFHAFIRQARAPFAFDPPKPVPQGASRNDPVGSEAFGRLRNPLRPDIPSVQDQPVYLIGTLAGTAYLYLVGQNAYVNAYVDEPVGELEGWTLKELTWDSASFSTPSGDQVLRLREGPAAVVRRVREGIDLFKAQRVEDALAIFEEALKGVKTAEEAYALILEIGEDVFASLVNSRNERARNFGFRLFELAKPGGERAKPNPRRL